MKRTPVTRQGCIRRQASNSGADAEMVVFEGASIFWKELLAVYRKGRKKRSRKGYGCREKIDGFVFWNSKAILAQFQDAARNRKYLKDDNRREHPVRHGKEEKSPRTCGRARCARFRVCRSSLNLDSPSRFAQQFSFALGDAVCCQMLDSWYPELSATFPDSS